MVLIVSVFSLCIFWIAWPTSDRRVPVPNAPRDYTYGHKRASNGMELHYLRTRPSNLMPESIHDNVPSTRYYGINGGFFYQKELLSIAIVNDVPVNQAAGTYGVGMTNVKYARGTLVWDGSIDKLSVQVAREASELIVSNRTHYWAQGGISMSLSQDDIWMEQMLEEHAPFADEERLRSAAVYDFEGNVYLVVSSNEGTLAAFRKAIVESIGIFYALQDGIFLDGDGSSQLQSREAVLKGDGRPVVQMLRILK
ncbi:hypothetical protein E5161_15400 [Cohnella pontilimi]|uniref:Phosphodiester glycosidase domain-containing protein n=1 Tax=Cohnella pontilimi TaxID=2564100 RepID=A0A4U0F8K9_9BACL|nr:hypothetical protein [Cohnella pontilimi]TJY41083.1 hypothetical protein E5161_15400 [Cohnella pontilimi]